MGSSFSGHCDWCLQRIYKKNAWHVEYTLLVFTHRSKCKHELILHSNEVEPESYHRYYCSEQCHTQDAARKILSGSRPLSDYTHKVTAPVEGYYCTDVCRRQDAWMQTTLSHDVQQLQQQLHLIPLSATSPNPH